MWPDWAIFWTLGNCSKPLATINLPKSLTFLAIFVKVSKSIIFLVKSCLGNFYRHLAIFFKSHCFLFSFTFFQSFVMFLAIIIFISTFLLLLSSFSVFSLVLLESLFSICVFVHSLLYLTFHFCSIFSLFHQNDNFSMPTSIYSFKYPYIPVFHSFYCWILMHKDLFSISHAIQVCSYLTYLSLLVKLKL